MCTHMMDDVNRRQMVALTIICHRMRLVHTGMPCTTCDLVLVALRQYMSHESCAPVEIGTAGVGKVRRTSLLPATHHVANDVAMRATLYTLAYTLMDMRMFIRVPLSTA